MQLWWDSSAVVSGWLLLLTGWGVAWLSTHFSMLRSSPCHLDLSKIFLWQQRPRGGVSWGDKPHSHQCRWRRCLGPGPRGGQDGGSLWHPAASIGGSLASRGSDGHSLLPLKPQGFDFRLRWRICPSVLTMLSQHRPLVWAAVRMWLGGTQEEAQNTEIAGCSNRIFPCARTVGHWPQASSFYPSQLSVEALYYWVEEKGEGKALIWRTWFKALVNKCEPGEQCNIITVVGWTTTHE